ncbi:hypothetical protein ACYIME_09420, partial [Enterococcus faecium]
MTKLFVSENDHEKAALSLAFLKITTILFRFRPKNKKRNYSSLNNGSIIYGTDESELILQPHF